MTPYDLTVGDQVSRRSRRQNLEELGGIEMIGVGAGVSSGAILLALPLILDRPDLSLITRTQWSPKVNVERRKGDRIYELTGERPAGVVHRLWLDRNFMILRWQAKVGPGGVGGERVETIAFRPQISSGD